MTLLIGYDDTHYYYIDPLWSHLGWKIVFPAILPNKFQIIKISKQKWLRVIMHLVKNAFISILTVNNLITSQVIGNFEMHIKYKQSMLCLYLSISISFIFALLF